MRNLKTVYLFELGSLLKKKAYIVTTVIICALILVVTTPPHPPRASWVERTPGKKALQAEEPSASTMNRMRSRLRI